MILGKGGQVVMTAANDPDEGDLIGVDGLQFFAVPEGDQPVAGAMNDIGMAVYMAYPFIGAQMIP